MVGRIYQVKRRQIKKEGEKWEEEKKEVNKTKGKNGRRRKFELRVIWTLCQPYIESGVAFSDYLFSFLLQLLLSSLSGEQSLTLILHTGELL